MLNNKIKFILALFIILTLSMNVFSATNFTDDSSIAQDSTGSMDKLSDDGASNNDQDSETTDSTSGDDQGSGESDTTSGDNQGSGESDSSSGSSGNSSTPSFNFNTTGGSGSSFNFSGMGGSNSSSFNFSGIGGNRSNSSFNISDIISKFMEMMGGNNDTNQTNETNDTNIPVENEVSNVPKVVTYTQYSVSQPPAMHKQSQHVVIRLRDNQVVNEGNFMILKGVNKLYDSDFTNGHLLVYIDGKLVFNEITTGDLSTTIFEITNSYVGQHQMVVEFTANDGNSNTNKYTEDVLIE